MMFSIVSPVYKGAPMLNMLVQRIDNTMQKITTNYEIVLVNDASPDNSWELIKELSQQNPHVRGVNLSRNFGQHEAITAGLSVAKGQWVVVMDCDLQDQPEEILTLWQKACEGYDVVVGQRHQRKDVFAKRLSSRVFYSAFAYLTDMPQDSSIANFGIYSRKVIKAVLAMGDAVRCLPLQVQWVGFRQAKVPIRHAPRVEGKSSYSLKRLLRFAGNNMLTFSNKPLRLMVGFGFVVTIVAFAVGLYFLLQHLAGNISVSGFTTLVLSLWFLGGLGFMFLGIVGIYIGKTFNQTKARPTFVISEEVSFEELRR